MGTLILVATPLGNLGDLSPRAIETLRSAALICCEDTRRTGKLLSAFDIRGVRMAIANEHTEFERIGEVLELLDAGATVAVVTDAGTPAISDPGERLVRAAIEGGHTVSAVPGPSAEQFLKHLQLNGIPAKLKSVNLDGKSTGEAILAAAKAEGCDLLVKGAFTQSRLRQMIFGGATSHILAHAELPVLMAH